MLDRVYGCDIWKKLYDESEQQSIFPEPLIERSPGVSELLRIYQERLEDLFGNRYLKTSRTLKNSKNSSLFEFIFCVGNPNGIRPAKRIAEYILENL